MDLMKELGLGFVLKFTDQTSAEVARARQHVVGLRSDLENTTRSFGGQVGQIGTQAANMGKLLQAAFVGFAGAAPIIAINKFKNAALESERQMMDLTTVIMSQGVKGHDEIVKQVDEAQKAIWATAREVPGVLDELEKNIGNMRARLGKDLYLDAVNPISKLSYIDNQGKQFQATYELVAGSLFKFRSSLPGKTDLDKVNAIGDAMAVMRGYGLDIESVGQTILRASKDAALYNNSYYEILALMISVAKQSSQPRMAGQAIQQLFDSLAQYPETVKELKKKGMKKGQAYSLGDALGITKEEEAIHPEARWLLNMKVTDASGAMLPIIQTYKQIEKGLKLSKKSSDEVAAQIKAGTLTPEEALTKGYNIPVYTASLMQQLFGAPIGMIIGHVDEMIEQETKLSGERGLVNNIFAEQMEKAAAQTDKLSANFKVLTDQIGDQLTPALNTLLKTINPWLETLGKTMEEHPTATKAVVGTTAVVGTAVGALIVAKTAKTGFDALRGLGARMAGAGTGEGASMLAQSALESSGAPFANRLTMGLVGKVPWGRALTASLSDISPTALSNMSKTTSIMGKLGSAGMGIGIQVLIPTEGFGKQSLSEMGMPIHGKTLRSPMKEVYGESPTALSSMSRSALLDLVYGKKPVSDSESLTSERTIYQTNYFTFLEATTDSASQAATIIDKNARQKAELSATGKN
jgi:hypothetical protein